jgi:hypothetical protein
VFARIASLWVLSVTPQIGRRSHLGVDVASCRFHLCDVEAKERSLENFGIEKEKTPPIQN